MSLRCFFLIKCASYGELVSPLSADRTQRLMMMMLCKSVHNHAHTISGSLFITCLLKTKSSIKPAHKPKNFLQTDGLVKFSGRGNHQNRENVDSRSTYWFVLGHHAAFMSRCRSLGRGRAGVLSKYTDLKIIRIRVTTQL